MILTWLFTRAAFAGAPDVDRYRRFAITCVVDQIKRPPRYRDRRVVFDQLTLFCSGPFDPVFVRAKYLLPRHDQMSMIATGTRAAYFESIEAHELRQRRRRDQETRAALMANALVADPREPEFEGAGMAARVTTVDRTTHAQLAVAILDQFLHDPPATLPVQVHLIHDEYAGDGRLAVSARKFTTAVARVTPLTEDERRVLGQLTELDRAPCERGLRN